MEKTGNAWRNGDNMRGHVSDRVAIVYALLQRLPGTGDISHSPSMLSMLTYSCNSWRWLADPKVVMCNAGPYATDSVEVAEAVQQLQTLRQTSRRQLARMM